MRHATFEVPSEVIGDFTEKLTELELSNSIIGKTEEDEIRIQIDYEKGESDKIDELESHLA